MVGAFLFSIRGYAGVVRHIAVNNAAMAPIYLKMGKSTILRFGEKPKKIVVGNQNYYGLEYIENDVAIQPLGSVPTNLFVYSENHTYGFLLTPGEHYDDLVFVQWKYPMVGKAEDKKRPEMTSFPNTAFIVGTLKITVQKIHGPSTFGLYMIDMGVENTGQIETAISGLSIKCSRSGKDIEGQSLVIEKDKLSAHEKTKGRIIVKLEGKKELSILAVLGKSKGKAIVGKKYL